ncbi:MAG: LacI family DNA-binding transcriptional regulator, partial [Saprospiraceae bacterium]
MSKEREVTIYDIADHLNLSIATVSRALKNDPVVNRKTKKKITDLAEKLGYRTNHFAKNLRTQRTNTIGVIIPRINTYFMSTVIAGMEAVANIAGYNLLISQSAESFEKEIESASTMFNNRVDGLLVSLAYETKNLDHFYQFLSKKIPLIFFDRAENPELVANIV